MNTTNTTDIHPGIAAILSDLEALPDGHYLTVSEGDFGYEPAANEGTWVRPASDFTSISADELRADIEAGREHVFGRWFRMDGTVVPKSERPEEWMDAEWPSIHSAVQVTVNAVDVSAGGYLWVSFGVWIPVAETVVDGEPAFEFVTIEERVRRVMVARDEEEQSFLDEHADAIEAVRPWWADEFYGDRDDEVIGFSAQERDAVIAQNFRLVDGALVATGRPSIGVSVDVTDLSVESAMQVANDLLRAAAILKQAR
ncbi:hypothetical protein [Microbacterium sp.]|uniref:hypothetical protein n=1 Tax=Microbacterium sp. TaxID=51671 RepID=UPI0039E7052F